MNAEIDITNVRLTSARLTLRPWRERDLSDFYEYAKVDGVGQMAGWKPHGNIEESKAILSTFIKGKNCFALEYHGKVVEVYHNIFIVLDDGGKRSFSYHDVLTETAKISFKS